MESSDLKALENDVLRRYERDGLVETLLGLGLVMGGLVLISRSTGGSTNIFGGLIPIFILLMLLLSKAWKRRITYPRLGYTELIARRAKDRNRRIRIVVPGLLAALVAGIILFACTSDKVGEAGLLRHHAGTLFFGGAVALTIAAAGIARKMRHLVLFAVLCYLLCIATYLVDVSGGYALEVAGGLLLIVGIVRLVLFLRENPILQGEADGKV
jgi:hypothetical protein